MRASVSEESDTGFSLLELLVVMIVLGVLAAVAVPVLLGQQRKAHEVAVKSDVGAIAREVTGYYVHHDEPLRLSAGAAASTWQLTDPAALVVARGALSPGNAVSAAGTITSDSSYCVAVVPSHPGAHAWRVTHAGLSVGDC